MKREEHRGGTRKGAGRPSTGAAQFTLHCQPATMSEIKRRAGDMKPGQFLDVHFKPKITHLKPLKTKGKK